jgi:hypothetical protein
LIGAVEDDIIERPRAEALLQRMRTMGYRAPITRLADVLDT